MEVARALGKAVGLHLRKKGLSIFWINGMS